MSISFSGLASGLDTDSWVSALVSVKQLQVTSLQTQLSAINKEQTTVSNVKSVFSKLQSALQVLTDSTLNKSSDVFAANKVTSSDEKIFTATVTADAIRDTYDVTVKQLATNTEARSIDPASKVADGNTRLSDLGISEGSVTVYVDGQKTTINIDANDTIGNLQSRLSSAGAKLEIDADTGFMTISAADGTSELKIGNNTDTSNFVSLLGLLENEEGNYESATAVYQVNGSTLLTDANSGFNTQITEGTFKIGNSTFTIDSTTTLDNIISQINNSEGANVFASWDAATGSIVLKSTVEGSSYINIESGSSNFTDAMGLTETTRDANGEIVDTKLLTAAQALGKNAKVVINGTEVTSTSNTVTADISRITGLTLNLKDTHNDEVKSSTLTIEHDTERLTSALNDFVGAYNELMSTLEEQTGINGELHGETTLKSIGSTLRSIANSNSTNDGMYTLLSQIGISTAEASNALSDDTISLTLDEDKLKEVIANNSDSVKSLLIGANGIITKIKDSVDNTLFSSGYFATKETSLKTEVKTMNERITKRQASVDTYKARLETKFAAMETVISKLNASYSSLMGA